MLRRCQTPELYSEFGASFKQGATIYQEGDWGYDLYLLLDGTVSIYKQYKGNLEMITKLHKGEIFGEMAIFENTTRSATVKADSFIQLLRLDRINFNIIYKLHPDWSYKLLSGLAQRINVNLKKIEKIQNEIDEDLKERERIDRWKNRRAKVKKGR